jgi:hypothetical protein
MLTNKNLLKTAIHAFALVALLVAVNAPKTIRPVKPAGVQTALKLLDKRTGAPVSDTAAMIRN